MTTDTDTTTVRRSIVVDAPIDRAFVFFTREIGTWWDANKHLLAEPLAEMVFEPHVGGHIIDRGVNGTENAWATVLAYDPPRPRRLQLGHQPRMADRDGSGQDQ